MSSAARSLFAFGIYVIVTGVLLAIVPAAVLQPLGVPVPADAWIRVVGVLAIVIGVYDVVGARSDFLAYIRASIPVRLGFAASVVLLVAMRFFEPQLLLFAAVDVAGAIWTATALRRSRPAGAAAAAAGAA